MAVCQLGKRTVFAGGAFTPLGDGRSGWWEISTYSLHPVEPVSTFLNPCCCFSSSWGSWTCSQWSRRVLLCAGIWGHIEAPYRRGCSSTSHQHLVWLHDIKGSCVVTCTKMDLSLVTIVPWCVWCLVLLQQAKEKAWKGWRTESLFPLLMSWRAYHLIRYKTC